MDLVLVGRIARTHGLRGDVVVDPETDFLEERFAPGAAVLIQRGGTIDTLRIASAWFQKGRPVVRFEGIGSIEEAEALGRIELWIDAATRGELPAGEYYHDALIGCRVETMSGEVIGTVSRVDGSRGAALLVIPRGAAGQEQGELLVPLAEAICPVIDPAARRIVIDPPEGLLELN